MRVKPTHPLIAFVSAITVVMPHRVLGHLQAMLKGLSKKTNNNLSAKDMMQLGLGEHVALRLPRHGYGGGTGLTNMQQELVGVGSISSPATCWRVLQQARAEAASSLESFDDFG